MTNFYQAEARAAYFNTPQRVVLNAGCGASTSRSLHPAFRKEAWSEVRLDVDPRVRPDMVGSIVDLRSLVSDAALDAIWCSHSVEHLFEHEVNTALREFVRTLKPSGFAFVTCPDLEEVARVLVEKGLEATAYTAPVGPITPLDIIYGHGASIAAGNTFMSHKTGFTQERLGRVMMVAGFHEVRVGKGRDFALWALGMMPNTDQSEIARLLRSTTEGFLFDPA